MANAKLIPLTLNEVIEKINHKRKGGIITVEYYSSQKTIDGSVLYKKTKMQARVKIKKENLSDYKEPTYKRTDDSTYIVDNAIKRMNTTNNALLFIFPFNSTFKTRKAYCLADGTEITNEKATEILKPKKPSEKRAFYTINAEQILYLK